jgi:NAD(P)-dependent dehydrogenase (short-subunit alcohol dehydrogenase family)
MTAKSYVITGANSGLGLAAAQRLAALGGHVILVCRDEQKASAAAERIRASTPEASLQPEECDLAWMASTRALAERRRRASAGSSMRYPARSMEPPTTSFATRRPAISARARCSPGCDPGSWRRTGGTPTFVLSSSRA